MGGRTELVVQVETCVFSIGDRWRGGESELEELRRVVASEWECVKEREMGGEGGVGGGGGEKRKHKQRGARTRGGGCTWK
jgi:hypothetical protein